MPILSLSELCDGRLLLFILIVVVGMYALSWGTIASGKVRFALFVLGRQVTSTMEEAVTVDKGFKVSLSLLLLARKTKVGGIDDFSLQVPSKTIYFLLHMSTRPRISLTTRVVALCAIFHHAPL